MEAYERLKNLQARGLNGRMIADYLGIHESTVSRMLRNPERARRFFSRHPELLEKLKELEGEARRVQLRWHLALTEAAVRRRFPTLTPETAHELALELLYEKRPDLFS